MKTVSEELVAFVRKEMPTEYKKFFKALKEYRGDISVVLHEGETLFLHRGVVPPDNWKEQWEASEEKPHLVIPHPVHLREGMAVRNAMRKSGLCKDWTDIDFDDAWVDVVGQVLMEAIDHAYKLENSIAYMETVTEVGKGNITEEALEQVKAAVRKSGLFKEEL